jgi:hypothetical protein
MQSRRRCGRNGGWRTAQPRRRHGHSHALAAHVRPHGRKCVCARACVRGKCVCVRARHGRISHEDLKQSPCRVSAAPGLCPRGARAALTHRSRGAHAVRTSATAFRAIATTQSIAFGWPSRACTSTASHGGDYIYIYTYARTRNHLWITVATDTCGCRQAYVHGRIPAAAHYCIQI